MQSMALKVSTQSSSTNSTASAMSVKTSFSLSHPVSISSPVCDESSEPQVVDSSSSSMSVDDSYSLSQSVGISSSVCDKSSVSSFVNSSPGASSAVQSVSIVKVSKTYMTKSRKKIKKWMLRLPSSQKLSRIWTEESSAVWRSVQLSTAFPTPPYTGAHNRNRLQRFWTIF